MLVNTYDPSQSSAPIQVTDAACAYFQDMLQKKGESTVRLWVKESGCSGYRYQLDIEARQEGDLIVGMDGFALAIDEQALKLLQGTTIDYVVRGLNGTIEFQNPNSVSECGCGESFSVDDV